jgi:hypothetical protein
MGKLKNIYRATAGQLQRITLVIGVLTIAAVALALIDDPSDGRNGSRSRADTGPVAGGFSWGDEVQNAIAALSPIQLANACGLGASSCYKCHNGKRAALPKMADIWHDDHRKSNYSCAGCHQGNPRLLKKKLAHNKLIVNPRLKPKRCNVCHLSKDGASLVARYQNPQPRKRSAKTVPVKALKSAKTSKTRKKRAASQKKSGYKKLDGCPKPTPRKQPTPCVEEKYW